jgi:hypothetical protein
VVAALIIGAVTAWYLGVRAGIFAAIISAALLVLALFVPPTALGIYIVLGAYCVGLYLFGTKLPGIGGRGVKDKKPGLGGNWKGEAAKWYGRAKGLWK